MKAFLIDPTAKTITEVNYSGNYRQIYSLCGWDTFDMHGVSEKGDCLAIDDEGLMKGTPQFFAWQDHPQPFAGTALLIGSENDEGETRDCSLTVEEVRAAVTFLLPAEAVGLHNRKREDDRRQMDLLRAMGVSVIDASIGLSLDEEGNAQA
jgi:hypothetical protein